MGVVLTPGDDQGTIARTVEKLMVDSLGQRLYSRLMEQARERG